VRPVRDFMPTLRLAIAEARAAGLGAACDELEARVSACCTTSSEWLGECGLAIQAFQSAHRARLPSSTRRKLRACLREISKVWPGFHPWWPWNWV
jgi:hypothetical protein